MNSVQGIELAFLVLVAVAAICTVLAAGYDVWRAGRVPKWDAIEQALKEPDLPLVTVLVTGIKDVESAAACIQDIAQSDYCKLDAILIIDRNVPRPVARTIRSMAKTSIPSVAVYAPRAQTNPERLRTKAFFRRGRRGEFVLCLDSRQTPAVRIARRAVVRLIADQSVGVLTFGGRVARPYTLSALYGVYAMLSRKVIAKALVFTRLYYVSQLSPALYRKNEFINLSRDARPQRALCDTSLAVHGQDYEHNQTIKIAGIIMTAGFAGYVAYGSLLAASLISVQPLLIGWTAAVLWLIAAIWSDETSSFTRKMTVSMPLPVSCYIIMSVLLVGGICKIIRRPII